MSLTPESAQGDVSSLLVTMGQQTKKEKTQHNEALTDQSSPLFEV